MAASRTRRVGGVTPLIARPTGGSDASVLAAVARGEHDALGELYDRFGSFAYGLALRVLRDQGLAADAVADAFLSVWRSAATFDVRRGTARGWVLMLVHRRAVDLVRSNQGYRDTTVERTPQSSALSTADCAEPERTERSRTASSS